MILERQIQALRGRFERLSQSERTLVLTALAVFVVMVSLLGGFFITDRLSTLDQRNTAMRQALRDLESHRESYLRAKAKSVQLESRLNRPPIKLQGYLEQAAKEAGVEIPEQNERPPTSVGKRFTERTVELRVRKVRLDQLANFLKRIETGPNLVVVTALNIRTRDDRHQELDAEMTVTTYERERGEKRERPGTKREKS
jgi:hypothetical protein